MVSFPQGWGLHLGVRVAILTELQQGSSDVVSTLLANEKRLCYS
jgi:hypothetical protein